MQAAASSLTFEPASHTYRLAGREVPSVTQALQLLEDFEGVPWAILEAARKFGQHVHEACALLVRGQLDWASLDHALVPYMECAKRFIAESGVRIIASELRLAHRTLRYAGTLDVLGDHKAFSGLYDFKSGVVPRTVGPQTAGYAAAYLDTYGVRVQRRYCVQLNPDLPNGYKVHRLNDPADWHTFLSALNCWRFKHAA